MLLQRTFPGKGSHQSRVQSGLRGLGRFAADSQAKFRRRHGHFRKCRWWRCPSSLPHTSLRIGNQGGSDHMRWCRIRCWGDRCCKRSAGKWAQNLVTCRPCDKRTAHSGLRSRTHTRPCKFHHSPSGGNLELVCQGQLGSLPCKPLASLDC